MSRMTHDVSLPEIGPQRLSAPHPALLLAMADAAAVILSGLACRALNVAGHAGHTPREILVVGATAVLCLLLLHHRGLYALAPRPSSGGRSLALVITVAHGFALLLLALLFWEQVQNVWPIGGGQGPAGQGEADSLLATNRNWLFSWAVLAPLTLLVLRRPVEAIFAAGEAAPAPRRALVLGDAASAARLARRLARGQEFGQAVEVVACYLRGPDDAAEAVAVSAGWPQLGGFRAARAALSRGDADLLLIALPEAAGQTIAAIRRAMAGLAVDIWLAPDMAWLEEAPARFSSLAGLPFFTLQEKPFSGGAAFVKRAEDLLLGGLLILLAAPLMLLIALAVRLSSPGPILFVQPRLGLNGRIIHVLKFRSMREEAADPLGAEQAAAGDRRITPVGRLLRRASLDELPQLLNVLGGSMSLVGPRPHALGTVAGGLPFGEADVGYPARHRVKPGMTGWAQVRGLRGETETVEKLRARVAHDLFYIARWSLWFDLRILAMTLGVVLRGEGV